MATKDNIVSLAKDRKNSKFRLINGTRDLSAQFLTSSSGPSTIVSVNSMRTWPSINGIYRQLERVLKYNGVASYSEKIDGSAALISYKHRDDTTGSGDLYAGVFDGPYLEARAKFFNAAYSVETGEIYYYCHRSSKTYRMSEYLDTSLSYFYLALVLRSFAPYIHFFANNKQRYLELHTEVLYTCLPNSVIYDQGASDVTVYIYRAFPSDSYDDSALIALRKTFNGKAVNTFSVDVPKSDGVTVQYETRVINSKVGFLKNTRLTNAQIRSLCNTQYDRTLCDPSVFIEKFFSIAKPQTKSPNIEGFVFSIHVDELGPEICESRRMYKIVNYRFSEIRNLVWAYRNRIKKHTNYRVSRYRETPWVFSRLHLLPLLIADAAGIMINGKAVKYEADRQCVMIEALPENFLELVELLIDEMIDTVRQDMYLYHSSIPYMRYLSQIGSYCDDHLDEILHKDRLSCYEVTKRMQILKDTIFKQCGFDYTKNTVHSILTS